VARSSGSSFPQPRWTPRPELGHIYPDDLGQTAPRAREKGTRSDPGAWHVAC
jgi:hypothetical protein